MQTITPVIQTILDTVPACIYWKNVEGVYIGCNAFTLERMERVGLSTSLLGKTDFDLFTPEVATNYREIDCKVMNERITLCNEEPVILPNKQQLIQLSTKKPLVDENNTVIGIMCITIDITERKKLEENLRFANQAKTEFLENMRHDIRTPLAGIVGCAHLIKLQPNDPEKIAAYADDLVLSSDALLAFLNKILESITVANGEIPLLKKKFNLREALAQSLNLNKSQAVVKGLRLNLEYDKKIPKYLMGDSFRIQRIIVELITNALKYTDKGEIKVSARLMKNKKREVIIELRVSDTGMGIPKDKHTEIYTRFTRLTPSHSGIYPGTGLGLSVVKQFIEDLDAEIHIESESQQGTVFICLIPFKKSLLMDKNNAEKLKDFEGNGVSLNKKVLNDHSTSEVVSFDKSSVLIVEDNIMAARAAGNILLSLNCQIDIAPDGKTALEKIEKNVYTLIFMDLGLPDTNGMELSHRIRLNQSQLNTSVPIIGLTAHVEPEEKQHCLAHGMNAVYIKPLTPEKATKILNTFISHQQQTSVSIQTATDSLQLTPILDIEQMVGVVDNKQLKNI